MSGFFEWLLSGIGSWFRWLFSVLESFVAWFYSFFLAIWSALESLFQAVGTWIIDCINYVWDWVIWSVYWMIDWLLVIGVAIIQFIFGMLPDMSGYVSQLSTYGHELVRSVGYIANFVPLGLMVGCFSLYIMVLFTWAVYKFVKSWIPTVSGS